MRSDAPLLEAAWECFVDGDAAGLATHLRDARDELVNRLARPERRGATTFDDGLADDVGDAYRAGLLARNAGLLDDAAALHRAVVACVWDLADGCARARWYQVAASAELAYGEANRNRASEGLRRTRSLRDLLVDAELREVLAEQEDVEEPALSVVEGVVEYLEIALGRNEEERLTPSYLTDEETHVDLERPPSSSLPHDPEAWPSPLTGTEDAPRTARDGLRRYVERADEVWTYVYEARAAAAQDRHDDALDACNAAIQHAEALHGSFRLAWEVHRLIAIAVVGRSAALEQLGHVERALEDAALASGLMGDAAEAYPQVVELRTDESWALATEAWRRCRAHRPDEEIFACCERAIALLDGAQTTPTREPDDVLARYWLTGHVGRHLAVSHRYVELVRLTAVNVPEAVALARLLADHAGARRQVDELAASASGPVGAVQRWALRLTRSDEGDEHRTRPWRRRRP